MAYRMRNMSDHVRAGVTSCGDLHIEVYGTFSNGQRNDEVYEILVPADALDELFRLLIRRGE